MWVQYVIQVDVSYVYGVVEHGPSQKECDLTWYVIVDQHALDTRQFVNVFIDRQSRTQKRPELHQSILTLVGQFAH